MTYRKYNNWLNGIDKKIWRSLEGRNTVLIVDFLIIILMGLVPLLWFKPGLLILDPDSNFSLDPQKRFIDRLFAWSYNFQSGSFSSVHFPTILYAGLQALLSKIFDLILVEKISYVLLFTLPGFSMYFLAHRIYGQERWAHVFKIIATVFYMFNFYNVYIWPRLVLGTGGLMILPVLLGILIKWLRDNTISKKDLLLFVFFILIGAPIGLQPPFTGILLILLVSYPIFHVITERKLTKSLILSSISKSLKILLLFTLVSAFWVIPQINYIIESGYTNSETAKNVFQTDFLVNLVSPSSSLLNVIRFQADYAWYEGWGGQPYCPWFQQYQTNGLYIFLSFIFPVLAFSALVLHKDKYVLFFSIISVVSIFLGKGMHEPFGDVFQWLYTNIPGFWVYRAPWGKFSILYAIGFSFLIGVTCGKVYDCLKLRFNNARLFDFKRYVPVLFIIIIVSSNLFYLYPSLLSGTNFPTSEGDYGYQAYYNISFHIKVPDYVFNSTNWINQMGERYNIFLLPDDRTNLYTWEYGATGDVSLMLYNKGLFFRQYGEGMAPPMPVAEVYNEIINYLYNNKSSDVAKILGMINTKYILQRNDLRYDFYGDSDSPEFIKEKISLQKNIQLEKTFGMWDFYKINNTYINPHIYPATLPVVVDGNINNMLTVATSDNFIIDNKAFFISEQTDKEQWKFLKEYRDSIIIEDKMSKITIYNNSEMPFNWSNSSNSYIEARYNIGWKSIIRTDGEETEDTLSFPSLNACPYNFPQFTPNGWSAQNSTLIYIKTDENSLRIDKILEGEKPAEGIVGIWWENDWMGMTTKPVSLPVIIPPNQKAIIQINHIIRDNVSLRTLQLPKWENLNNIQSSPPSIAFKRINPTKYQINIENATHPFFLIFSDGYHSQWKAYAGDNTIKFNEIIANYDYLGVKEASNEMLFTPEDISYLFTTPLDEKNHFIVNGYANAWYIDPNEIDVNTNGSFTMTLYFLPQSLFYVGLLISCITLLACIAYLLWNYQNILRKPKLFRKYN